MMVAIASNNPTINKKRGKWRAVFKERFASGENNKRRRFQKIPAENQKKPKTGKGILLKNNLVATYTTVNEEMSTIVQKKPL